MAGATKAAPLKDSARLRLRPPALEERRGRSHLLVWGELARWMVVDDELRALLGLFNGKRPLAKVLRLHARRQGRPLAEVRAEAAPLLARLTRRQVLGRRVGPPTVAPEAVRVANVTVNLTNRCNLRCAFCYNDAPRDGEELPVGRIMDALEAGLAADLLTDDASFIVLGGEPTLAMDRLEEALRRAEALFTPPPLVSTNGTLLDDARVARLARRRLEVQVSLDGAEAAAHDAVRGPGVFNRATAGVRRLVAAGVPTVLSMVLTRDSSGPRQLEAYLDLARELGAAEARFIPMRLIGLGTEQRRQVPDLYRVLSGLLELLQRRPELRPLLKRDYFSILATVCRHSSPRTNCGIGRKVLFIDADGTVYPCPNHRLPSLACGHLARQELAELLDAPAMKDVREAYVVDAFPACRGCPFRYWCAGDCRGEVLHASGDPLGPSPHCEELKRIFLRLLWLEAEGKNPLGAKAEEGARLRDMFS